MTDGLGATSYTWRRGDQLAAEDGPGANDTLTYTKDATASGLLTGLNLQQPAGSWAQTYVIATDRYDPFHRSTRELVRFLKDFVKRYNENCGPYVWTKGPKKLRKIIELTRAFQNQMHTH